MSLSNAEYAYYLTPSLKTKEMRINPEMFYINSMP